VLALPGPAPLEPDVVGAVIRRALAAEIRLRGRGPARFATPAEPARGHLVEPSPDPPRAPSVTDGTEQRPVTARPAPGDRRPRRANDGSSARLSPVEARVIHNFAARSWIRG
jgi:hypothetical protein